MHEPKLPQPTQGPVSEAPPEQFPAPQLSQTVVRTSRHLERDDIRVLLLWLLVALAGAGVAYRYFFRAFPEAAVNFKLTRTAALDASRAFVTSQGSSVANYRSTVVFGTDDVEKTYLEREVGLAEANRLMSSEVSVFYWDARFFRPLQKEEFRVHVDPGGRIVAYEHQLEEAAPGAHLERAEALARAEAFLRDILHTPLERYSFLPEEANSVARTNRTDWTFTWERNEFRAKDAPYRLRVTLQGDRIGGYDEFLKVPDEWERSFARLRSSNDFMETIALIPYALLLGAALSVVVSLGRRGLVRWHDALLLGGFITALYFVMQMNQWPLTRAGYNTNGSYSSFFVAQIAGAIATSALLSLMVVIAYIPGEPLYRIDQPQRLRFGSTFSASGLRSKDFFMASVIGFCMAAAHIGYVVLFYIAGRRFGVWAPEDLKYSDTLSTALPWMFPLTIGIYAATSEEFLFRMFSVHFLLRSTKSKLLAIVLPAFAWGFLHSNYPQQPAYIRGIEVGLIGIVAGLVMLRWGIWATLTWHYTVDAFLSSLSLMRADDWYSRISGAIVGLAALIPIGIAGTLYLTRGGFVNQEELLNRAEPLVEDPIAPVEQVQTAQPAARYQAIAPGMLGVLALCAVLGVIMLIAVKPMTIGDFIRFPLNAREAEGRAADVLRSRGVDPLAYRHAVTTQYTFDPLVNEYLRRSVGIDGANRIYRDQVPSAFWAARYFRDSQKEEYFVVMMPDGTQHSVHHTVPETAPGPNMTKQDAMGRAEDFLRDAKKLDLSQWKLVESQSNKLPFRTDHSFVWEQIAPLNPSPKDSEGAHTRISLSVQGDEVSSYRIFIHVPEQWRRAQSETTLAGTARAIAAVAIVAAFVIIVLVVFFRNLKQPELAAVPWRRLSKWAVVMFAGAVATFATQAPQYLLTYRTDLPFRTFIGTLAIVLSLSALLLYSAAVLLFGLAWFFIARSYGADRLPAWRGMPAAYYRDALISGLCGTGILLGLQRLPDLVFRLWPVLRRAFPANTPEGLDANWPAVHAIAGAVTHSVVAVGLLLLLLGVVSCYLRWALSQAVLLAVLSMLAAPVPAGAGDFVQSALIIFVVLSVIWWGAQRLLRLNVLGYLLVAMLGSLSAAAANLLKQPNTSFHAQGWIVVGAGVILLLWTAMAWSGAARRGVHPTGVE